MRSANDDDSLQLLLLDHGHRLLIDVPLQEIVGEQDSVHPVLQEWKPLLEEGRRQLLSASIRHDDCLGPKRHILGALCPKSDCAIGCVDLHSEYALDGMG